MGCASSTERHGEWRDTTFQCLRELQGVLRWSGLRSTNLIIGVDFTRSNMWNGKLSFGGRCLHFIDPEGLVVNPYQVVINIIGRTLLSRKSKRPIHVFGFGDARTADRCVFTFLPDGSPCRGVDHVLAQYKEIAPKLVLGGPTNFAPIIYQAIRQVKATGTCSILVIIADGQVASEKETSQAIAEASNYALSIIVVGVGDGPWEDMEHYTDTLPKRRFENFHFVNLNQVMSANPEQSALGFATVALAHIPDQLADIRRLGLLQRTDRDTIFAKHRTGSFSSDEIPDVDYDVVGLEKVLRCWTGCDCPPLLAIVKPSIRLVSETYRLQYRVKSGKTSPEERHAAITWSSF